MATHEVKLTYGGSVFDFTSGSNTLMSYVPQSPDLTTIDSNSILDDGGERTMTTRRNVTESLAFRASASSQDELQASKQRLQSFLMKAERHQKTGAGSPVYITVKPYGTTASAYRSEILSGKVDVGETSLGWQWNRRNIEFVTAFTRRYYWEGEEVTAKINNPAAAAASRIAVYNENVPSLSRYNYFDVAASAVTGEIPTPAKIIVRNDAGSSMDTRYFQFWHNVTSDPANFNHFYQAEDGTTTSGSIASNAAYSGGSAWSRTLTANLATSITVLTLSLSGSFLDICGGGNFAIFARCSVPSGSLYARAEILYSLTEISESLESRVAGDTGLVSFGIMRLPPNISANFGSASLGLNLKVRSSAGGTWITDFVEILPIDTGYSRVKQLGYIWVSGLAVMDHITDNYYLSSSSYDAISPLLVHSGNKINLYPHELQRIYMHTTDVSSLYTHRSLNVELKYRPRRLTI